MRSILAQIKSYAPGFALALVIALLAKGIEALLPFDVIGASVIAMFIGMLINGYRKPGKTTAPGVKFTAKKILKFAIILLGASLNVTTILNVGRMSLTVMLFTLLTCFGGGYFIGRALGLDWKLSNLISAGTGICGGSAIAAVAPVIDAKDSDIAYALSATFLFDMAMIVLFPIMGRAMGLSDMAYGLCAGTAVNDTSSVVAAGYAFSEGAGDFATMVKLTRTLAIIPTVVVFSFVFRHKEMSFVISSFFAGVGGALLAMFQTTVQAMAFKSAMTYEILLIVVIGGIGSVTGSVLASFLFIACSEWWLRFLDAETYIGAFKVPLLRAGFRKVVFSIIIMAVVLFYRQGIMGDRELNFDRILRKRQKFIEKTQRGGK